MSKSSTGRVTKEPRTLARFFVMTIQGLRVLGVIHPDRRVLTDAVDTALTTLEPAGPSGPCSGDAR